MSATLLPFALVLGATVAGLLLPALFRRGAAVLSRAQSAGAILRDKLAQLARDREEGLIGNAEAAAAEAEISRALIAVAREAEAEGRPGRGGGRAGIAAGAALALAVGVGIYWTNGSYWLAGGPDPAPEAAEAPSMLSEYEGSVLSEAIASLRSRLEADPENVDHWHLLARSYKAVGAHEAAAEAYARLIKLAPLRIELRGDYGEALVQAQGGFVGPDAAAAFEAVLAHVPEDPRALYYLALRDAQSGDSLKAAQGWARILRTAPADAPYRAAIQEILDAIIEDAGLDRAALDIPAETAAPAAPGPSQADVEAAAEMPTGEQLAMIRGMVDRLEARLAEEPDDIDGWLRLARSRTVLGESEAATAALERALVENPGNPELQAALAGLRGSSQ